MLQILFEDNHLLVVDKPAGLLVQPDATGDASLYDVARDYRKTKEGKPGAAFVGVVHRLDRPVSGVVLLAKTSKAAARLSEQFRKGVVTKTYWAVVEATPQQVAKDLPSGETAAWRDQLVKSASANRTRIAEKLDDDEADIDDESTAGKSAITAVRRLESVGNLHLIELQPKTGRSHQLRSQCAARGLTIYGDRKYGSKKAFHRQIALHAYSLQIQHPTTRQPMLFATPAPASWRMFPCSKWS